MTASGEFGEVPLLVEQTAKNSRVQEVFMQVGKWAARGSVAAIGFGLASSSSYATAHDQIGPARVEAHLTVGDGDINGEVALLGNVSLDPSLGPFGMNYELKEVPNLDIESIESEFKSFEPKQFEATAMNELKVLSAKAALKGGMLGVLGGALAVVGTESAVALGRRAGYRKLGRVGAIGLATSASLAAAGGAYTWHTFESDELTNPTYSNSLEEVMGFVNNTMFSLDRYKQTSQQATKWLNNILTSAETAEQVVLPGNHLIPVLAVSDIHGRPCTLDRMKLIIDRLNIEFVVDAGDMSEWDEPAAESAVFNANCQMGLENYGELGVPVYTVLGNHDGRDTRRTVNKPNVTVLSGEMVHTPVDTGAISIIGDADPRRTVNPGARPSLDTEYELVCDLGDSLGEKASSLQPNFTVVHSPIAAERVREALGEDDTSWIITGHSHRFSVDEEARTITLGTAGGAGFRTFQESPDTENVTMQFQVLYIDPDTKAVAAVVRLLIQNDGLATSELHVLDHGRDMQLANDAAEKSGE